jgi:hypothetical protein
LGLTSSDDLGTTFDVKAEVFQNDELVGSGQINDMPGGSSGFNSAISRSIGLAFSTVNITLASNETLSLRLSARIGAHRRDRPRERHRETVVQRFRGQQPARRTRQRREHHLVPAGWLFAGAKPRTGPEEDERRHR